MNFERFGFAELLDACRTLDPKALYLSYGLSADELEELKQSVRGPLPVARRETLYVHGSKCEALYVVERGAFKTYLIDADGDVQITGFRFAGELLGLDALQDGKYHCTAVALEPGYVFRLPTEHLADIVRAVRGLERELLRLMSHRIREDEEHMLLLSQKSAPKRLATYLLYLNQRNQPDMDNPRQLCLPMTRQDLACYLGLAVETVSRRLHGFEKDGVISVVDRKHLRVLDPERLAEIAGFGAAVS